MRYQSRRENLERREVILSRFEKDALTARRLTNGRASAVAYSTSRRSLNLYALATVMTNDNRFNECIVDKFSSDSELQIYPGCSLADRGDIYIYAL
jgi:hypothetical protein